MLFFLIDYCKSVMFVGMLERSLAEVEKTPERQSSNNLGQVTFKRFFISALKLQHQKQIV